MGTDPPPSNQGPDNDRDEIRQMWRQAGAFAFAGLEFVAAVLVGYWAGSWLDARLGTGPWLTVVAVGLGFCGVCWSLLRTLKKLGIGKSGEDGEPPDQASHDDEP